METHLNSKHTKVVFCLLGALLLGLIAYLDYRNFHYVVGMVTASMSAMLVFNALFIMLGQRNHTFLDGLSMLLLAFFAYIASDHQQGQHIYWIYFYPIAAFFLFQLKVALALLLLYLPLVLYIIFNYASPLEQPMILFSFAAISTVVYFLAMVKARTNYLLAPLISTDLETGAQLEKFLRSELGTEITRAEREGTGLLLMYIRLDKAFKQSKKDQYSDLINQSARAIANQLRIFDHYYRLAGNNFAVVLPHTTTEDATHSVQHMIENMPSFLQDKIEVGLASLNVGDTADSLLELAITEAKHV